MSPRQYNVYVDDIISELLKDNTGYIIGDHSFGVVFMLMTLFYWVRKEIVSCC